MHIVVAGQASGIVVYMQLYCMMTAMVSHTHNKSIVSMVTLLLCAVHQENMCPKIKCDSVINHFRGNRIGGKN